jgi:hypothetical protein
MANKKRTFSGTMSACHLTPNRPLTKPELAEYLRQNSLLAPSHVEENYRRILTEVASSKLAPAPLMQKLVVLWRILRSWRRN